MTDGAISWRRFPGPAMAEARSIASESSDENVQRLVRRLKRRREVLVLQTGSYLLDTGLLAAYVAVAGRSWHIPIAYLVTTLTFAAILGGLSELRISDRLRDHYMSFWHSLGNIIIQLSFLYLFPEFSAAFLCPVFVIVCFAALRVTAIQAAGLWALATLGVASVIALNPNALTFPHVDTTRRLIGLACLSAALARCGFIGLYGSRLRSALYARSIELKSAYRRIEELAELDELTGAMNRRSIMSALDSEIALFRRTGSAFSVALIDLDWFKLINDCHGHPVGDEVLRTFAITMFANIRSMDKFGRYGGEEFLLIMPETSAADAAKAIDRMRHIVGGLEWSAFAEGLAVTFSAGTTTTRPEDTVDSLLARADRALYVAKAAGRNQIASA